MGSVATAQKDIFASSNNSSSLYLNPPSQTHPPPITSTKLITQPALTQHHAPPPNTYRQTNKQTHKQQLGTCGAFLWLRFLKELRLRWGSSWNTLTTPKSATALLRSVKVMETKRESRPPPGVKGNTEDDSDGELSSRLPPPSPSPEPPELWELREDDPRERWLGDR
jgi:hypothetical protein